MLKGMGAMRLGRALRECGYMDDVDAFRDGVVECFQNLYPAWTDEQLLHKRFCRQVRERFQIACDDELVLRTLSNARKHGYCRKASV
jgi:hypothetical protein